MKKQMELPKKQPLEQKYKQPNGPAWQMSSDKSQKRKSCGFIPGISKKPGKERVVSEVFIFFDLKHRFDSSAARLKSFTRHDLFI